MRSFEECRAEIFRRSEKRIKERARTRKSLLICSVSLIVCGALVSAVALWGRIPTKLTPPDTPLPPVPHTTDTVGPDVLEGYVRIEISGIDEGNDFYRSIDSRDAVSHVADLIGSFGGITGDDLSDAAGSRSYLIKLTAADGGETVYVFEGNTLVNRGARQVLLLSDDEVAQLKTALGLPNEKKGG